MAKDTHPQQTVAAPRVYAAVSDVAAVFAQVGIGKTRQNEQQKFMFRGIDQVMNALAPLLVEHRLLIVPRMVEHRCEERTTTKGTVLFFSFVAAEFDFVSVEDGSTFTARTYGEAMDSGDKATNKAMAIAYKYAAFQTFCIPTEGGGDTDPDATSHDDIASTSKGKSAYAARKESGDEKYRELEAGIRNCKTVKALQNYWTNECQPAREHLPGSWYAKLGEEKDAKKAALGAKTV